MKTFIILLFISTLSWAQSLDDLLKSLEATPVEKPYIASIKVTANWINTIYEKKSDNDYRIRNSQAKHHSISKNNLGDVVGDIEEVSMEKYSLYDEYSEKISYSLDRATKQLSINFSLISKNKMASSFTYKVKLSQAEVNKLNSGSELAVTLPTSQLKKGLLQGSAAFTRELEEERGVKLKVKEAQANQVTVYLNFLNQENYIKVYISDYYLLME